MTPGPDPLFRDVTDHQLALAADGGCDDLACRLHGPDSYGDCATQGEQTMSTDERYPSDVYDHVPDQAATGDGRAIAQAILALADEVQSLRLALEER